MQKYDQRCGQTDKVDADKGQKPQRRLPAENSTAEDRAQDHRTHLFQSKREVNSAVGRSERPHQCNFTFSLTDHQKANQKTDSGGQDKDQKRTYAVDENAIL